MDINVMKPGILVAELVTSKGGIEYKRNYLEDYMDGESRKRKVETDVTIHNEQEFVEARALKGRSYQKLRKICARTPVGLICPKDKQEELANTVQEIRKELNEFNQRAQTVAVKARYAFYEVREDNYATIAAVAEQVADVAASVQQSIEMDDLAALSRAPRRFLGGLKPEVVLNNLPAAERDTIVARARAELIRAAVVELKGVETLFPSDVSAEVKGLVKSARKIARNIRKNVDKRELTLNEALSSVDLTGIKKIRTTFIAASIKADSMAADRRPASPKDRIDAEVEAPFVPLVPPVPGMNTCF